MIDSPMFQFVDAERTILILQCCISMLASRKLTYLLHGAESILRS
jgi:hypothetical protein